MRSSRRAWVRLALEMLDPDDRNVVLWREYQDLSFAEIGARLQVGEDAARVVGSEVGVLKVGLELFVREGPAVVEALRGSGAAVFLDLKLHDIPETVDRAVGRAGELGVRWLTVHAGGGAAMIERAARRAERAGAVRF